MKSERRRFSTDAQEFLKQKKIELDKAPSQSVIDKSSTTKYSKKKVEIFPDKPRPDKQRPESSMVVPYISTKTFPDYIRMMIESYDWMPAEVHYVMNDVRKAHWMNKFDYKACETFRITRPTKYFVMHASDNYLMPEDLARFKQILDDDPKCFAVGIYPIGANMAHSKLFKDFNMPTRICLWRADIFEKTMDKGIKDAEKAFNGAPLDCVSFMASHAHKMGYHAKIDAKARPFMVHQEEFKTMWINPNM